VVEAIQEMSRSKHTRPYQILAASRVRAPYEPRRRGDKSSEYVALRTLKELGIAPGVNQIGVDRDENAPLPRILNKQPRGGRFQPLSRSDIIEALQFFGASCIYGIKSISLASGVGRSTGDGILLGAYVAPGRVLLFDQRPSPWRLTQRLPEVTIQKLRRAGADLDIAESGLRTIITWPGETLRAFLLFDGLMHEIGHHILQHSKGKRYARVVRTRDHEEFADRFAQECRARWSARDIEKG
jgi:hypothetical protein